MPDRANGYEEFAIPPDDEREAALPPAELEVARHIGEYATTDLRPVRRRGLITRRRAVAGGLAGFAGLMLGGALWAHHQADEVNRAQMSVNSMLNEVIQGMLTNNQFREAAAACGDVEIDLDLEQQLAGDAGSALALFEAAFGTSNEFRRGLDGGGDDTQPRPFNQPNAITQIGATSLDRQALDTLRITEIITRVLAHPGAYSGDGPYPGTNIGGGDSMISGQLNYVDQPHNYSLQRELRETTAKPIIRVEGGYDDYRVLFASVAQLAGRLSDVTRLATSRDLDRDMQHEVETFLDAMDGVASQFGRNLIAFADNLSEANDYRLEHGLKRITMETVFTWNFVRQRYFPFGAIDGDNSPLLDNPLLGQYMHQDPTGPPNLNRYMIDVRAIPAGIGPKLAFIAWGKIVERQIDALRIIGRKHPRLHRAVADLIDLNRLPEFYKSQLFVPAQATPTAEAGTDGSDGEYTQVLDQGDGHPGGVEDQIAGAERIAQADLNRRVRRVRGKKSSLGEHSSLNRQPAA